MSQSGPATFQSYYQQPYNAIVQPQRFQYYFRKRWMRELGPVATSIVIYLRGLCYRNVEKGELRNICECRLEVIAEGIGVSRATVARELSDYTTDDAKKGTKAGDPVNGALQQFVSRQQQYNITPSGVRRSTTLYHVSMDDPLHPDDQLQYEMLCLEQSRKEADGPKPLKPVYKPADSGEEGAEKPKSQFETKAPGGRPKSQIETERRGPKSQIETDIDSVPFDTNVGTLNVPRRDMDEMGGGGDHATDVISELVETKVAELVSALGDPGSTRRYRQLVGICERNNQLSLVEYALGATVARKAKVDMPKPGAYFQRILLKKLEDRGIHIPSVAESMTRPSVATAVVASLSIAAGSMEAMATPEVDFPPTSPRGVLRNRPNRGVDELAEIALLEKTGGCSLEAWRAFNITKRQEYERETSSMPETIRTRLLSSLSEPDRQRAFWREWIRRQST